MRVLHVGDDYAALRPCGLTLYSEALMDAQARGGHEVSYVFSGRHYPRLERPRLKRWRRGRVAMYELVGPPIHSHWEAGTRDPLHDLSDAAGEAVVATALREARPEIVHVHELARLPSSVLELVKDAGIPVVMTLHDYKPVCASVRLLDADAQRCLRSDVGEDCARNCAGAPEGPAHLIDFTMRYEWRRAKRALPVLRDADLGALARPIRLATRLVEGPPPSTPPLAPASAAVVAAGAPAEHYQRRRDVNLRRLGLCDRLVAPSLRVAEIYAELGVEEERIRVQRLTLPHLERLSPGRDASVGAPLRFLTLGGCASASKGSRMLTQAVEALERDGRGGAFELTVLGHCEPAVLERLEALGSVTILGPYSPRDLETLLDAADVGILPSIWEEAHGFVGIEMLAKGLPVIGSALGGITEYVQDGRTGWLNRSVTAQELARLMAAAIDDRAAVEAMRRTLRAERDHLARPMREHVEEVEALYAEVRSACAA